MMKLAFYFSVETKFLYKHKLMRWPDKDSYLNEKIKRNTAA